MAYFMRKFTLVAALALVPLLMAAALFTGIEVKYREHDTDYSFFVKQQPSLQLFFNNPIVCGECDVEAFEKLSVANIDEIRTYCRQRFGLDNLRMCHAIFAEHQRQVNTTMQNLMRLLPLPHNSSIIKISHKTVTGHFLSLIPR